MAKEKSASLKKPTFCGLWKAPIARDSLYGVFPFVSPYLRLEGFDRPVAPLFSFYSLSWFLVAVPFLQVLSLAMAPPRSSGIVNCLIDKITPRPTCPLSPWDLQSPVSISYPHELWSTYFFLSAALFDHRTATCRWESTFNPLSDRTRTVQEDQWVYP